MATRSLPDRVVEPDRVDCLGRGRLRVQPLHAITFMNVSCLDSASSRSSSAILAFCFYPLLYGSGHRLCFGCWVLPCARAQDLVRTPSGDTDAVATTQADRVIVTAARTTCWRSPPHRVRGQSARRTSLRGPVFRPGEIMETIPGVIVTQHSGSGKANQYFLRGFNLDHGTDLATDFEGMPSTCLQRSRAKATRI